MSATSVMARCTRTFWPLSPTTVAHPSREGPAGRPTGGSRGPSAPWTMPSPLDWTPGVGELSWYGIGERLWLSGCWDYAVPARLDSWSGIVERQPSR